VLFVKHSIQDQAPQIEVAGFAGFREMGQEVCADFQDVFKSTYAETNQAPAFDIGNGMYNTENITRFSKNDTLA
jgi:hypothetical protein